MNELLSVGSILLVALLAGHAARWIRIPEVTGYILAGVAVGPGPSRCCSGRSRPRPRRRRR
jgi:Kef-type K+ transport system membrane component KefB